MECKQIPHFAAPFLLLLLCFCSCKKDPPKAVKPPTDMVDMVYPHLDTENSRWFFFASASRPFGMVNLSPDTQPQGTWGSGYQYKTDTIKGFSHVHGWQISGLSDTNKSTIYDDFASKFSHDTEKTSPGYHRVILDRYGIAAEHTGTKRVKKDNVSKQQLIPLRLCRACRGMGGVRGGLLRCEG